MGPFCGFWSEQNFPGDAQYCTPNSEKGGGATLSVGRIKVTKVWLATRPHCRTCRGNLSLIPLQSCCNAILIHQHFRFWQTGGPALCFQSVVIAGVENSPSGTLFFYVCSTLFGAGAVAITMPPKVGGGTASPAEIASLADIPACRYPRDIPANVLSALLFLLGQLVGGGLATRPDCRELVVEPSKFRDHDRGHTCRG